MVARRFWYRVDTGEEIPLEPSDDACLPLFEKPMLFGLHEEMLDEARDLGPVAGDYVLVSLAVSNGWTLVDDIKKPNYIKVIARSEDEARNAIVRLNFNVCPRGIRVETLAGRFKEGRKVVEIDSWNSWWFIQGTPLDSLHKNYR